MYKGLVDAYRTANKLSVIPPRALKNLHDLVGMDDGDDITIADSVPSPTCVESMVVNAIDDERTMRDLLSRTWPYFSAVIRKQVVHHDTEGEVTDMVVEAIRSVAQCVLDKGSYGDLRALIMESDDQPALFGGRGSDDAEKIAADVCQVFLAVRSSVLLDLVDGYTYAEIAERNELTEEAVGKLLRAIRAASGRQDLAA